jgi:hypothetical protein
MCRGCGIDGRLGHSDGEEACLVPEQIGKELFGGAAVFMVACGGTYTVALTKGGGVWTWGLGVLGHGDTQRKLVPTRVPPEHFGGAVAATVSAGAMHTIVGTVEGDLFTWGRGKHGRLGLGDEEDSLVPSSLARDKLGGYKAVMVAVGFNHSLALTACGALWAWGDGCSGRLGVGDRNQRLTPTLVGADETFGSKVVVVACGSAHSLAATEEGLLFSWGYGADGRLGLKDNTSRLVPTRVRAQHLGNSRAVSVAAGSVHSTVVTQDGGLWTWGPGEIFAGAFKNVQVPTGLGHGETADKPVPSRVPMGEELVGRCRRLPPLHALAFAMATHKRLGKSCVSFLNSDLPSEVLRRIIFAARAWPSGPASQEEGVLRIMGAGLMTLEQHRVIDQTAFFKPSTVPAKEEEQEQEEEDLEEEEEGDSGKRGKERGCRCGRTKCLKQYCQCFRNDIRCTPDCVCLDCHNDGAHEEKRIEAIRRIRMTNFRAFKVLPVPRCHSLPARALRLCCALGVLRRCALGMLPPVERQRTPCSWECANPLAAARLQGTDLEIDNVSVVTATGSIKLIRGCRCKRSRCKKKYCEVRLLLSLRPSNSPAATYVYIPIYNVCI